MKKQAKQIIGICLIVLCVLAILFSGFKILSLLNPATEPIMQGTNEIQRNGVTYFPRQDINVMLVMGIDLDGPVKDTSLEADKGEADMVALVVFDETNRKINIVHINRDTMVDMNVIGIDGKKADDVVHRQLAMAHTYGTGLKDSCENTRNAVSNLFYGLGINYYVAINQDAIPILNDTVGGVTVEVTEDFSAVNPDITMGTTTLMGKAALDYVQIRENIGDQTNISRMSRQEKYMKSFMKVFNQKTQEDEAFLLTTYDAVDEYVVTNFTTKSMSSVLKQYADYEIGEVLSLDGELKMGPDGFYEYHLDEKALDDLVLRMFFKPQNG